MKKRQMDLLGLVLLVCLSLLCAACAPSQEKMDTLATEVAAGIYATLTAQAPIETPTATIIPSPTAVPSPTTTPTPGAMVAVSVLNVREGPGTTYTALGQLNRGEELDITGQFENCSWVKMKSRSSGLEGWVAGGEQYIELRIPCEQIPLGVFHPQTGWIQRGEGGGYGTMTVDNGTAKDGVVILTANDQAVMAAYIRAGEKFTLQGIQDGTYALYFSTGSDWNGKEFMTDPRRQRFTDAFEFSTSASAYTIWDVTLHTVTGGTASAQDVGEGDFPAIGE
ncbi:hypothetical protein ADN00_10020 [Ornatilinea apprima]|uniref:SH3b domain-containing protein n=1 Tax=Ornatilinea apprima TaxID=1134406 RepID=A0A0P6X512_9CHLR|nr:SH3 domain-containing protein [Ornatilinea apprima]KPL76924.1 hypothetical protein ADN00_10020 [Ornatilinea apprima]